MRKTIRENKRPSGACVHLALREAEIEEQYRPEPVTAAESNEKLREVFALWGIEYAPVED